MHHSTWGTQVHLHLLKAEVVEAQTHGQLVAAAELSAVLRTPAVVGARFPSEWRIPAELPAALRTPVVARQSKAKVQCEWRTPAAAAVAAGAVAAGRVDVDGPESSSAAS